MLKTFTLGGIHPPENKLSTAAKIRKLDVPESVIVPIGQHLGAPSAPVVKKGDVVKVGQLLAKGEAFVSANIHAPVSGTIQKIDKALDSSGYKRDAFYIKTDGDEWQEGIDTSPNLILDVRNTGEEILEKIKNAGIVGLGGATFPTHVKLSIPRGKKAEYVIINGVECEPYLTADHMVMLEHGEEIIVGTQLLMKALGVEKAIVGIEINKHDALEHLTRLTKKMDNIHIQGLKVKYPQGGEKQLIKAVINREVPSGGLPIDVGAVVFNVGTCYAVYEAVQKNKPLVDRVVTVTGKNLRYPSNFRVRFGTPVSKLIEAAGGIPDDCGKIINGGPMMGKALSSPEIPVIKGTSGILLMPKAESKRGEVINCIRCSKCISVCPMGLEPYLLMALSEREILDRLESEKVMDCVECGSCSFTCPSSRPLLDYIRLGKGKVGKIIRSRKQ